MQVRISKSELGGVLQAVSSKSYAHRALILAALADGSSKLTLKERSEDIEATAQCLEALGAHITFKDESCFVDPLMCKLFREYEVTFHTDESAPTVLNCGESGSTLRFLLTVSAALGKHVRFEGRGRLLERPHTALLEVLQTGGVKVSQRNAYIELEGRFQARDVRLPGNISSQFISSFMLASQALEDELTIHVSKPVESLPYLNMSAEVLKDFGGSCEFYDQANELLIVCKPAKLLAQTNYVVEGDWSQAAPWLAIGTQSEQGISIQGLNGKSAQGDAQILTFLRKMGASIDLHENAVQVHKSQLHGMQIDLSSCPDLVPALCIAAAFAQGETQFTGTARLRIKESDRIAASVEVLDQFGISCSSSDDSITITGKHDEPRALIHTQKDHRIVMMACLLASQMGNKTAVENRESVNKSYPSFIDDFRSLGGCALEEE